MPPKKKITATTKEKETREGDQEEKPQKEKELPWHPCGVGDCKHKTQYPNNLPRHKRNKHGVIEKECCGHTYRTQADLDAHRLNNCEKRFGPCPNCNMYFARKDHLEVHIGLNQENIDAKNKPCKKSKQYLNTKITKSGLKERSNGQSAIAVMKETSPGLHQKIVAEDKAVESRTRDYLGDWEKTKPVEGRRRPKKAVERFQLFEAKNSSLNEERDKVGKAKEALEPQETGPISTNEERMQVTYRELEIFTPPRGRLFSRYTSSPTEEYQVHFSDDDVSVNHNTIKNTRADSAFYTLVPEMDESCQSTESNLDRREQLTWDEEKAERVGHEQLLRGEGEALATSLVRNTKLQEQLEEQKTEHRIHSQRLENELEGLRKDKSQLIEQLNAAEEVLAKERCTWQEEREELETRVTLVEEGKTELQNCCKQ